MVSLGLLMQHPPIFRRAHPHDLAVNSGFFIGGYEATPLQVVRVPLWVGRSILHQRGRLQCHSS